MRHLGNTFELLFLAPEHWILSGNWCNVMKQCGRPMQIFPMMWIVLKNCNVISKRQSFSTLMTSLSHILRYEDLFLQVMYQEHHCCVWASEHHQASISLTCWDKAGLLFWVSQTGRSSSGRKLKNQMPFMKFGEMSEIYSQNHPPAWTIRVNIATDLVLFWIPGVLDYVLKDLGKWSSLK